LILTNTDRLKDSTGAPLKSNSAEFAAFQTALQSFAAHSKVQGQVVDLANDPNGIGRDYAQWDQEQSCVPAANLVSQAIHDLIAQYRNQHGSALKYVTI